MSLFSSTCLHVINLLFKISLETTACIPIALIDQFFFLPPTGMLGPKHLYQHLYTGVSPPSLLVEVSCDLWDLQQHPWLLPTPTCDNQNICNTANALWGANSPQTEGHWTMPQLRVPAVPVVGMDLSIPGDGTVTTRWHDTFRSGGLPTWIWVFLNFWGTISSYNYEREDC